MAAKKKVRKKKILSKKEQKELLNLADESKLGAGANVSNRASKAKKKARKKIR